MAAPACTRTRSSRTRGATSVASTRSCPCAVRTIDLEAVGRRLDHLAQVAFVAAGDAAVVVIRRLGQQPGVLEAQVGQLPEHVVAQHEPAVERCRAVRIIDPDDDVGPNLRSERAGRDPQGGDAPRRRFARGGRPPRDRAWRSPPPPRLLAGPPLAPRRRGRGRRSHTPGRRACRRSPGGRTRRPHGGCARATPGRTHHSVAPAAKRRARASDAAGQVVAEAGREAGEHVGHRVSHGSPRLPCCPRAT